jgi:hypothetical protein
MPVRHLPVHLNLQLALGLGASLLALQAVSPVSAQTGNQSDGTNPGISNPGTVVPIQQPQTVFPGENAQSAVNQAAGSLTGLLSENALTTSTGEAISPSAQQDVLNILIGGEQSSNSISAVSDALSNAPGAPPLSTIQDLLSKLKGLVNCEEGQEKGCEQGNVTPAKLLAAVRAYNAMILVSNVEFLNNPPAELLAIQASLAKLIAATTV